MERVGILSASYKAKVVHLFRYGAAFHSNGCPCHAGRDTVHKPYRVLSNLQFPNLKSSTAFLIRLDTSTDRPYDNR